MAIAASGILEISLSPKSSVRALSTERDESPFDLNDLRSELQARIFAALSDLRDGYAFAQELTRDVWEFAVEIHCLQEHGLRPNDLRWLLFKGSIAHRHEKHSATSEGRCFTPGGSARFDGTSCFVLTPKGARTLANLTAPAAESRIDHRRSVTVVTPCWDPQRQHLWLGSHLVKQFKVPANAQQSILNAFEEEKWPPRIDDPLPWQPEQDRKRRLHNTINALNRKQLRPLIRFLGDGRGLGVRWELNAKDASLRTA